MRWRSVRTLEIRGRATQRLCVCPTVVRKSNAWGRRRVWPTARETTLESAEIHGACNSNGCAFVQRLYVTQRLEPGAPRVRIALRAGATRSAAFPPDRDPGSTTDLHGQDLVVARTSAHRGRRCCSSSPISPVGTGDHRADGPAPRRTMPSAHRRSCRRGVSGTKARPARAATRRTVDDGQTTGRRRGGG